MNQKAVLNNALTTEAKAASEYLRVLKILNALRVEGKVPANRISAIVARTRGIWRDGITPRALFRDHGRILDQHAGLYDLEVARDEFDAAIKQIKRRTVLGEPYAYR